MQRIVRLLAALAAVVVGLVVGYRQILPPVSLPAGFTEREVTLAEASDTPDLNLLLTHIKAMAQEAHPVDTPALLAAQDYLKQQLTLMGYAYEEQIYQLTIPNILQLERERVAFGNREFRATEESIREYSGIGDKPTMRLNNIVVTLDAPNTDETILFMAHTDSVKMGPGAYDDTVSVAALLEGLRQLRGETPARDLVFLFSDGEEQALLGAAKFVADNRHLKDRTRLVINLEARGNSGALLMFETTDNNLGMVREYVKGAGTPVSLSIATSIYRTMQNDTDLTRFMMAGYPGLNFAAIQGAEVYHTEDDNVENFDRVSAAHYLSTVTGLVNHFALAESLTLEAEEDGVFFPFTPGRVLVLPRTLADILAWAAPVLYLMVLVRQLLKRRASLGPVLLTALWQALSMGLAFLWAG